MLYQFWARLICGILFAVKYKMELLRNAIIRKARPSDINQMTGLLKELFSIEEDFIFNEVHRDMVFPQQFLNKD